MDTKVKIDELRISGTMPNGKRVTIELQCEVMCQPDDMEIFIEQEASDLSAYLRDPVNRNPLSEFSLRIKGRVLMSTVKEGIYVTRTVSEGVDND